MLNSIQKTHLGLRPGFWDRLLTMLFSCRRIHNYVASSFLAQFVRHDFLNSSRMTTLEEAFEQFKQLPDWDRFPMPEVFYQHFNLKKPQPSVSLMESLAYQPPPHQSLNKDGKVEIRKPAEGGVREIKEYLTLPVEQTFLRDQTDDDTPQDSEQTTLNPPTEDATIDTQPASGHSSPNPCDDVVCTSRDAPCHDAECNQIPHTNQNE